LLGAKQSRDTDEIRRDPQNRVDLLMMDVASS
jgi:hypothetical protein